MKNEKIILFIILLMEGIMIAYAAFDGFKGGWGVETFTGIAGNPNSNWSDGKTPFGICQLTGNGRVISDTAEDCALQYINQLPELRTNGGANVSCKWQMSVDQIPLANTFAVFPNASNNSYGTFAYSLYTDTDLIYLRTFTSIGSDDTLITGWKNNGAWQNITIEFLNNLTARVLLNGSVRAQSVKAIRNASFVTPIYSDSLNQDIEADNFSCSNMTETDITAPIINITNINASNKVRISDVLNITGYISGATTANITFNLTGNNDLYNFTFSPVSDVISQNITLNITGHSVINASITACDSLNNCAINSTLITTIDRTDVTLNTPPNNNKTHNLTIFFNFSIDNIENFRFNYSLYADTNSNPTTAINLSNNTLDLNWTFEYTFTTEILGSINGTYYWKINGSDNITDNYTSSIYNFNITNKVDNTTNVSITTLPSEINTQLKGHYNQTCGDIYCNISISDYKWQINGSFVATANNNTFLNAPNVTLDANISFCSRTNDGYGGTAWTELICSSNSTIGDTVPPAVTNISTQNLTSFITTDTINITAKITDTNIISLTKLYVNKSDILTEYNLIHIGKNIYQFADTFAIGNYNIAYINATDGSSNKAQENSTISFTVSSPPSGDGGTSGGGGGGGGLSIIKVPTNQTVIISEILCNFNKICEIEIGEDFVNCGNEKSPFDRDGDCGFELGLLGSTIKNQLKFGLVSKALFGLFIISVGILVFLPQENIDKIKKGLKRAKLGGN